MATKEQYDLIVIGGGASGLMAAGVAAKAGKRVLLLEKNRRLGEKLRISGGGRCNITNAEYDTRALLTRYGDAEQFLYSAFTQFGVKESFSFFEELNLPLVVEAGKRAFPASQKATDVAKALEACLAAGGVVVKTGVAVSEVIAKDGAIEGVVAGGTTYRARSYALATGGVSHPETGSTGDGFGWLRQLGHTVKEPTPTIVPLSVKEPWAHELKGRSLEQMKITFRVGGKKAFAKTGKLLFTHFGLSGPLILNSSKDVADLLEEGEVTASIDCFPDSDHGALDDRVLAVFDTNKNKLLKNVLREIVPPGTAPTLLTHLIDIDPDKKVHSITTGERKRLVDLLKALPVTVTGLMGADRAVVADGGVLLSEVDMRTMRSKRVSNLFITGDLLHINRPSGGFSLQLCWTTGFVAGSNA